MLIGTRYGVGVQDESWFDHRKYVLGNITAPSLLAQTDQHFVWALFVDEDMPASARAVLEEIVRPFGDRVVFFEDQRFNSPNLTRLAQERGLVTPAGFMSDRAY